MQDSEIVRMCILLNMKRSWDVNSHECFCLASELPFYHPASQVLCSCRMGVQCLLDYVTLLLAIVFAILTYLILCGRKGALSRSEVYSVKG